ncbi:MAG: YqgE/AlgH family protein [Parachlamydiaceae bacterium]
MVDPVSYSQIQKGTLLIATPDVDEGFFFRGVILVCEHNANGSFGLLINKALDLELPQEVLDISQLANPRVGIRAGGPVQVNQMMLLHTSGQIENQTLKVCDGVYLGGDLQFLQQAMQDENGPYIHLCFGYSGWSAGHLEREFLDGHWFLHPGNVENVFHIPPENLWKALLREMGGKYAAFSMIPEDLSLN